MPVRVSCPVCGRIEIYEPEEEDVRTARERGLTSISFFHGDHALVVYFDANGQVRRTSVVKSIGEVPATAAPPLSDIISTVGAENIAYLMAAVVSGGRVVIAFYSPELAQNLVANLRKLVKPLELPVFVINEAGEAAALREMPCPSAIIVRSSLLPEVGEAAKDMPVVDLSTPMRLDKESRKGLKVILDAIDHALRLRDESYRTAYLNARLARLRALAENALRLLGSVNIIRESDFKKAVAPDLTADELAFLYFALNEFTDMEVVPLPRPSPFLPRSLLIRRKT